MAHRTGSRQLLAVVLVLAATLSVSAQTTHTGWEPTKQPDTLQAGHEPVDPTAPGLYPNIWSIDVLIANDGFGLGGLYRRTFTPDLSGFISVSVSESKDDREFEYIDPYYGVSYTPGKLNRFLVIPLMFGLQYRLFREDIVDTFRPYINAGAGPAMIFQMPYVDFVDQGDGSFIEQPVDFFKSIGRGHPHYTAGGFVGFGSNFGTERSNIFGVNFRYYFMYMFGDGLPSLYDSRTRQVSATKTFFGGFVISLNIGMAL